MSDRLKGLFWIGVSYIAAFSVGLAVYFTAQRAEAGLILSMLLLDLAATLVVWLFGLLFRNASFYDPYWSVAPHIMVLFIMIRENAWSVSNILFLLVFTFWSVRLTANWAQTFRSINAEDWRYQMYRKQHPRLWPLINFSGIHLMPTLLVFVGLLPAITLAAANVPFQPLELIGAAVILFGTVLELLADRAIHRHLQGNSGSEVCRTGLWKIIRHPNYLGEILVWFGVWLWSVAARPAQWILFPGFLAILCLFFFASIPMMEKRQLARRPGYARYKEEVGMLLPRKRRNAHQALEKGSGE